MEIERKAVASALRRAGLLNVRVVQTGIGKDAVIRSLVEVSVGETADTLMVLAGSCGGLAPTVDGPHIEGVIA